MTFGNGGADFLVDSAEAVAQSVRTRLLLFAGEWFLDLAAGTPWLTAVLGQRQRPDLGNLNYLPLADSAVKDRILGTFGVRVLYDYTSVLDPVARRFTVDGKIF